MHRNKIVDMKKVFGNLEVNTYIPLKVHSHSEYTKLQYIKKDLFATF